MLQASTRKLIIPSSFHTRTKNLFRPGEYMILVLQMYQRRLAVFLHLMKVKLLPAFTPMDLASSGHMHEWKQGKDI